MLTQADTTNESPPAGTQGQTSLHEEALYMLIQELPKLAGFIEENAVGITDQFKRLATESQKQSDHLESVINLSRSVDLEGQKISFDQTIEILYLPLAEAIEKILHVSKLAMSMVMTISNAAENIDRVESFIDEVQAITKQTNMLAMNTQIEAARAGEAGKSFQIIAEEVKNLSTHIRDLSGAMQREIMQVANSVKQSTEVIDSLAYYDMTENIQLKEKIDNLINSMVSQNKQYNAVLSESAQSARETANSIAATVVGIQFQDRSNQVIGDLLTVLQESIGQLAQSEKKDLNALSQSEVEEELRNMLEPVRLTDMRKALLQSFVDRGVIDEGWPIYQEYFTAAPVSSTVDEDGDDIELF